MSGRGGRNRARGRFPGRGRGNKATNTNTRNNDHSNSLQDHTYQVGKASNVGDYVKTTEFLLNHIQKTFSCGERIVTSLEQRKIVNEPRPRLVKSTSKDAAVEDLENEEFKLEYKLLLAMYHDDEKKFKEQMGKTYGLIFSQCSPTLQRKIKTMADFLPKVKNNPIELLTAIERFSIYAVSSRNPYVVVMESWINLLQTKQRDDENVMEYTQRFVSAKDMYETLAGGPQFALNLVLAHASYDETTRTRSSNAKQTLLNGS
jgi:hypothetical protein